jgi:hypothetical protein
MHRRKRLKAGESLSPGKWAVIARPDRHGGHTAAGDPVLKPESELGGERGKFRLHGQYRLN